jgi:AraC-like DNA-binding protein
MTSRLFRIEEWETLAKHAHFQPGRLAALCPISLRHLERFFEENLQKTPSRWLRELQCRLAKDLISKGFSNKAVTAELKFASQSHFCREFKKIFGVSPQNFSPMVWTAKNVANGQECRL